MPYRPPKRCINAYDGCDNYATAGKPRCSACEKEHQARRNASRAHYGKGWSKRAAEQVKRVPWCQCPGCQRCDPDHPGRFCARRNDLTADHIVPGDPNSALRTLCRPCNSSLGSQVRYGDRRHG